MRLLKEFCNVPAKPVCKAQWLSLILLRLPKCQNFQKCVNLFNVQTCSNVKCDQICSNVSNFKPDVQNVQDVQKVQYVHCVQSVTLALILYSKCSFCWDMRSRNQILTLYMVCSNCPDDSKKVKQFLLRSYLIGHKFINPIDECWF